MIPLVLSTLAALSVPAHAADGWVNQEGVGALKWGTSEMPFEVKPRDRKDFLPDTGFIGSKPGEKPNDIELQGDFAKGEHRFIRYVQGSLADAWHVLEGEVDADSWSRLGVEEWRGPVLGPADDGWRSYGDATSWRVGDKTVLHWRDRSSPREILAVRTVSVRSYKAIRAAPLSDEGPNPTGTIKLRGQLKSSLKPMEESLSGCLNQAEKPIEMRIELIFDYQGRPGRIKVDTDKVAPNVLDCVAGALSTMSGQAGGRGAATAVRMR
jgi:hypothetical protein